MEGLRLSAAQIELGATTLVSNKLKSSQVEDLVSIFRDYLGALAGDYPIRATLEELLDTATKNTCAKLAACLLLWQQNDFDNGGFAPTNANRTGFNYSLDMEQYKIFRYAFGLFWDIPAVLDNEWLRLNGGSDSASSGGSNGSFSQGVFIKVV